MNNRNINIPDGFNNQRAPRRNFLRNIFRRNDRIVPVEEEQVQRGNPRARRVIPLYEWNADTVNAERARILARIEQARRQREEDRRQREEDRRLQTIDYIYGHNIRPPHFNNVRPEHFSYNHYLVEPSSNDNPVIGELFYEYFVPVGVRQVQGIRENDDIADVIGEVVGQDNHRLRRY